MCSNSVSCPLCCQNSFPNIDSLRISLIKVANGPLLCPICKEILLGLDKLTIHLFGHTSILTDDTYVTNNVVTEIDQINSSEGLNFSSINPSTPPLYQNQLPTPSPPESPKSQIKCDICGLSFRSTELFLMHNNLVHRLSGSKASGAGDAPYQCYLCAKIFKMKGSLRVHLKVVHLLGLPTTKNASKLNICEKIKNQSTNTDINPHHQLKLVKTEIPITSNNKTDKDLVYATQGETIGEKELSNCNEISKSPTEVKSPSESSKVWECDICSKSFTTKYFLKKHKRLHTGEMPYTCEICGKTFTFQQSYHKHILYHSDEKPHVCQTCGRAFKELSTLHNHERIHSGEKPFKCEACGKCFRQRVSYLVHKRIHTGVMPYTCTACKKSFRYKVSQRTHKCTGTTGTVVRQNSNLLQKLLHSTEIIMEKNGTAEPEPTFENSKTDLNEELLNKSIDDIVAESCKKMGIGALFDNDGNFKVDNNQERIHSPSEKFQNLCLYPSSTESFATHLETINEDSFKQLIYGVNENL